MAVNSYLPEAAGGLVAAASFDDEAGAIAAVRALHDVGLRWQDVVVLATDGEISRRIAKEAGAYAPRRSRLTLPVLGGLPREVRTRYGRVLDTGKIVVIAASDGQPADTLATVLERVAKGSNVAVWWQEPSGIFPPPEEGGPL
ncbi:MAG: hypothetical protein AUH85_01740 [Chloroflexi bacterium 13_1_40CM_4_68_4]|nr:MAG: hypothetical protein AUH85_01740 [Chloroflexi bacterium 13_1_40CM_4_68_4]